MLNFTLNFYTKLDGEESPYLLIHQLNLKYSISGISVISDVDYQGIGPVRQQYETSKEINYFDIKLKESTRGNLGAPIILDYQNG